VPAKLLGLALILAGLLLRHRTKRARRLGYVGPRYRRIHRNVDRTKFNLAITAQVAGALICFISALLCFTHSIAR
jgi:hypothetical protein